MSQKITSKNLTYDTSLPPFLARLRGQQSARSGPDPILAAHRRPGQKRSASEEAEDAPVVVDEDGNVVTGFLVGSEEDKVEATGQETGQQQHNSLQDQENRGEGDLAQKEKVAGIGGSRKRKVGRVVGEGQSSEDEGERKGEKKTKAEKKSKDDDARIAKASADVRRLVGYDEEIPNRASDAPAAKRSDDKTTKSATTKKKKPAKKIKLSFRDDDGE
ncbi:hypothetical protein F5Y07DRAFT_251572 [Xylaria sp. FL0933]|nr:hypothetical protein F5Y07DRAFT_251572 [Xylaria sp. FL0933]